MTQERMHGNMTMWEAIRAIAGEHYGASLACKEINERGGDIDPDGFIGGFGILMALDSMNIWDERIHILWNDVCESDTVKLVALLRAQQLGQLAGVTLEAINRAIDDRNANFDHEAILVAVKERLPNFNPSA